MKTLYNLDKLLKVTLFEKARPRFVIYQAEKRGWFNRIKTKAGFYSMLGFSGWSECEQPLNTYIENNKLYYYPYIEYKFIDGTEKDMYFKSLDDCKEVFDNHRLNLTELDNN